MNATTSYARLVNRFSATRAGSWLVRHVAARIDPIVFRLTGGRFTSTGRPTLPMLTLTTVGRESGQPRTVQLAYARDGDTFLVVASAMGQARHPAWRYNLESAGTASIHLRTGVHDVAAATLSADEKRQLWPLIAQTIPQMATYADRTDRDIKVFRLTPLDANSGGSVRQTRIKEVRRDPAPARAPAINVASAAFSRSPQPR